MALDSVQIHIRILIKNLSILINKEEIFMSLSMRLHKLDLIVGVEVCLLGKISLVD